MGNDAIDYINRDIVNVKEELRTISKLVRDGNGQPSLIQQVTILQSDISRIEVELKEQIANLQEGINALNSKDKERSSLVWQFKTAIAVALITGFTSIFIHYNNNNNHETELRLEQIIQRLDKQGSKK